MELPRLADLNSEDEKQGERRYEAAGEKRPSIRRPGPWDPRVQTGTIAVARM